MLLLAVLCHGAEVALPDQRVGALPPSAALPGDTAEAVALGRLLFFDPILSATREVACATCHHPRHGWADDRATSLGVHGIGIGPKRRLVEGAAGLEPATTRVTACSAARHSPGFVWSGPCGPGNWLEGRGSNPRPTG